MQKITKIESIFLEKAIYILKKCKGKQPNSKKILKKSKKVVDIKKRIWYSTVALAKV